MSETNRQQEYIYLSRGGIFVSRISDYTAHRIRSLSEGRSENHNMESENWNGGDQSGNSNSQDVNGRGRAENRRVNNKRRRSPEGSTSKIQRMKMDDSSSYSDCSSLSD